MLKRALPWVAALGVASLALAGCSGDSGEGGASTEGPWTIGLSNAFIGSEYRTQMVDDVKNVFEEYKAEGVLDELVLENADTDTNGQIQQIRNLINRGVDAIIVDPSSETALNEVFKEATDQGILVLAVDQAVTEQSVTNVVIDQGEWARPSSEWLAEQVGEGGKIVVVNGMSGHPANEVRWGVAKSVFDAAGVEVLTVADGGWDQATGQQVMSDLLAAYPDIDGVWTQDGMAQGVLRAIEAAGKTGDIIVSGEARGGYMRMWNDLKADGYASIGVVNPPGTAGTAVHVAVALLQGKTWADGAIDGNTLTLPTPPVVTNDNFDDFWAEISELGDAYVMDDVLSRDDVLKFFK
jgi:ribose transport system substrate-binding protein